MSIDWRAGGTASELVGGKSVDWADILDGGVEEQAGYTSGWDTVLGRYTAYLER